MSLCAVFVTPAVPGTGACAVDGTFTTVDVIPSDRYAAICFKVRNVPRCSGLTLGAPGNFSDTAERISTRLMESMPRSPSRSMSGLIVSAG